MPPRQSVAPNDIQNIFPHSQRVPLGSEGFTSYGGTLGPGGAGQYWFYIPTTDPGTVLVTLDGGPADVRLVPERALEVKRDPGTLRFQVPIGGEGIFHLYVTPARPVRVRFICEGWPKERDGTPLIPWNFWYFPFNPTSGTKGTFDSAAVQRSAMQKYDRAFHPHSGGPTWDWEQSNHVQPHAAGWEGHCGMAAYASVYFEQPPEGAEVNGTRFTRDELELLATEWAGRRMPGYTGGFFLERGASTSVGGKHVVWFMKPSDEPEPDLVVQRYREAFPQLSESELAIVRREAAALDGDAVRADFGAAAARFLGCLIDTVKVGGEAVIGDFGPNKPERTGLEIWNVALVYFAVEWKEMPLQMRDPRACNVSIAIVTNVDTYPQDAPSAPAEVIDGARLKPGRYCQTFQQELELRYDGGGLLQRTRWLSCGSGGGRLFAPHTLVNVQHPGPASGSGNPFIGDELLRAGTLRLRKRFQTP